MDGAIMNDIALALTGGVLIGAASAGLLLLNGRIAGVTGVLAGLLAPERGEVGWRAAFVAGLVAVGGVAAVVSPASFTAGLDRSGPSLVVAGLLVGFGTRLGNGCTSGHGVCGIGRLSPRSIAATVTFIAVGMASVAAHRVLWGPS